MNKLLLLESKETSHWERKIEKRKKNTFNKLKLYLTCKSIANSKPGLTTITCPLWSITCLLKVSPSIEKKNVMPGVRIKSLCILELGQEKCLTMWSNVSKMLVKWGQNEAFCTIAKHFSWPRYWRYIFRPGWHSSIIHLPWGIKWINKYNSNSSSWYFADITKNQTVGKPDFHFWQSLNTKELHCCGLLRVSFLCQTFAFFGKCASYSIGERSHLQSPGCSKFKAEREVLFNWSNCHNSWVCSLHHCFQT